MKKITYILLALIVCFGSVNCSDFLNRQSENIITEAQIYSDPNMTTSALANFYGRIAWGQQLGDEGDGFAFLDEACFSGVDSPNNMNQFSDDWWRVYDYNLIRDLNQFIAGVRSDDAAALDPIFRQQAEGEARFIRAWTYFNMVRCMGGVSLMGDEVNTYTPGMDISKLQVPRSTEAETYNYILSECSAAASLLPTDPNANIHAARANQWVALALKARAAIYAGTLAKYNNLLTPTITTPGGEVGIASSLATAYFDSAYATAQVIINGGMYSLYNKNLDKGRNFYEALGVKTGNPEVMWAQDYVYPGNAPQNQFTTKNLPTSVKADIDANKVTPILNLVEDFEYINDRDGKLHIKDAKGDEIYYDNLSDIFANKDPRLYGTVIYPGSDFRGETITYQAGQRVLVNGVWTDKTGLTGSTDELNQVITDVNGPIEGGGVNYNKAGFNIRKFIDEDKDAGTRGRGSDMWFVRFRYAEVLLIAAEAAYELGDQTNAVKYINQIRERAGIQNLVDVTHQDLVQENRVEFAFENHRYWDLKRWRLAHTLWNGDNSNPTAVHYVMFPFRVVQPGDPNDGKWVFERRVSSMTLFPRNFRLQNYYNFYDQSWLNNNPQLVRNPFQ